MPATSARTASNEVIRRISPGPRAVVLAFALPVLALKLLVAARTYGTNDIFHWGDFVDGVRTAGPVNIYGLTFARSFYNHPPLMGYVLWVVNGAQDLGIPYRFSIRALASFADVGSALVVLELLRRRRTIGEAKFAAISVALSPLLFVVSGFHGNTDPDFVFLTVCSLYLLVDRRLSPASGAVLALAVGVKIIPMIVVPAMAVYAFKRGPRSFLQFTAGFTVVFGLSWGPALLRQFGKVRADVLGYAGNGSSLWGYMQIGHWMHDPGWVAIMAGPGRVAVLGVCALVPAIAVWRRPEVILQAVAFALIAFLALATSFGVQYLVWPLVVAYLVGFPLATAYNVSAGLVLIEIYNRWSGGLPWDHGIASAFTAKEKVALGLPWIIVVGLMVQALVASFGRGDRGDRRPRLPPVESTQNLLRPKQQVRSSRSDERNWNAPEI